MPPRVLNLTLNNTTTKHLTTKSSKMKNWIVKDEDYGKIQEQSQFLQTLQEMIYDLCQQKKDDINIGFELGMIWSMIMDQDKKYVDIFYSIYETNKE
jgi:hypothetical protein